MSTRNRIQPNAELPSVKLRVVNPPNATSSSSSPPFSDVDVRDLCAGAGRVTAIVTVPGALTPTCHLRHVPGFLSNRAGLERMGISKVVVVAPNDAFVMAAWRQALAVPAADRQFVIFASDGNLTLTTRLGLLKSAHANMMGWRCHRSLLLVDNATRRVKYVGVDEQKELMNSTVEKALKSKL